MTQPICKMSIAIAAVAAAACSKPTQDHGANAQSNATAAAPTPKPSASVKALGPPQLGYCHGGGCSWSREADRLVIRQDGRGRLIRLTLLGGFSDDMDATVQWNARAHDVYVFCSTRLPAVMLHTENGWQVDAIDFVAGVPGVLMSSAAIYARTCHGREFLEPEEAAGLGYKALPEDVAEVRVDRPEQIFEKAG